MNLRGVPLELHPEPDYMTTVIAQTGDFFEAVILDELARRLTGGTLVDAGAMVGNHTAYLSEFIPAAVVHAFEPVPANFELLRRNTVNRPNVVARPFALSDRTHKVTLRVDPANYGHATIEPDGEVSAWALPLDIFGLQDVRLLKIDVEGHEPEVLAGAKRTIDLWHPLVLIEDWTGTYGELLPGYRLAVEWETAHQTFLYEPETLQES